MGTLTDFLLCTRGSTSYGSLKLASFTVNSCAMYIGYTYVLSLNTNIFQYTIPVLLFRLLNIIGFKRLDNLILVLEFCISEEYSKRVSKIEVR